ncbi:transcriptional regulator [Primorskyibacter flagellatus]|uniref:Transcriptional regulator n=1 Tax=Primorskyibacter flagellatus TaxID=1387277 RepID=A0A917AI18_9RHOB|nr:transcriptional regulator GcvA [Primorskyibacter flagellatus]GGE50030.1 transcriptional regulator [Primorskyibacter flagellatus]
MRRLPPLNALRALEAAGRHGSFSLAAAELNVTPGAVSRQIKLLEETFDMQLFERRSGALEATEKCRDYATMLSDVFDRIETATTRLTEAESDNEIKLSASMTFTLRWMVPRMTSFHDRHPHLRLRLSGAMPPPRMSDRGEVDVYVQLGDGSRTDLAVERLLGNDLVPVCSPRLLEGGPPLETPEDLANHTLLHSMLRKQHWPHWLRAVGVDGVNGRDGNTHGSSALCYQAAIEGLGVAMAQINFVIDDIAEGRLVTPFRTIVADTESFNLIRDRTETATKVQDFAGWIHGEARTHEDRVRALTRDYKRLPAPV